MAFNATMRLQIDDSTEYSNSVLFWQQEAQNKPFQSKSTSIKEDIVHFDICLTNQTNIEYWYQNSKKEVEIYHRKFDENYNLVDKFNCRNLIINTDYELQQMQKEYTTKLYYLENKKQEYVKFGESQQLYISNTEQQASFILEYIQKDCNVKQITFTVQLKNFQEEPNNLQLNINITDIEELIQSTGKFKYLGKKYQVIDQKIIKFQDFMLQKYNEILNTKKSSLETISNQIKNLESLKIPEELFSNYQSYILKDNFMSQTINIKDQDSVSKVENRQTQPFYMKKSELVQRPISGKSKDQKPQQTREQQLRKKQIQIIKNKKFELDIGKIGQLERAQFQNSKDDLFKNQQTQFLQATIVQNDPEEQNKDQAIQDYKNTVEQLNLKILNLKIEMKNRNKEYEDLLNQISINKNMLVRIQHYYDPRNNEQISDGFQNINQQQSPQSLRNQRQEQQNQGIKQGILQNDRQKSKFSIKELPQTLEQFSQVQKLRNPQQQ